MTRSYISTPCTPDSSGVLIPDITQQVVPESWPADSTIVYKTYPSFWVCSIIDANTESPLVALDLITVLLRLFAAGVQNQRSRGPFAMLGSHDVTTGSQDIDIASNLMIFYQAVDIILPGGHPCSVSYEGAAEIMLQKPAASEAVDLRSIVTLLAKDLKDALL